jgi:hypothetical protein
MKKKLYIPTSSLNFNNIFASESISPAVFYSKRNFGYKTLEKIELNNYDNSILLYDKLPDFKIDNKDRDNYPMIIEIDWIWKDIEPIRVFNNVSIFRFSETIYLNPFSTKIYFLSEETKKITLLGAERSSSTKMASLYNNNCCFQLVNDKIQQFQFTKEFLEGINDIAYSDTIGKSIDKEGQINRAKGFMYSFLVGANKSLNKELVAIKKAAREIGNIISAVIHSPDKSILDKQKRDLDDLCRDFNGAFCRIDEKFIKIEGKIKELCDNNKLDVADFKKALQQCNSLDDVISNVAKQNNLKKPFNINELFKPVDSTLLEEKNCTIIEIVSGEEKKILCSKEKINISQKIDLENLKLQHLAEEKPDYYKALINEFLSLDCQNESKLDIAVRGINILIKMFEDGNRDWKGSQQQTYYNTLLANIQGKDSFNVSDDNNIVRQSFALFVLYKEDIEKIENSLVDNLIPEFSYAFGLWGAFWGFASMPKTLTNSLFLSGDLKYIEEVYKCVYKQVHGIELDGNFEMKVEKGNENHKGTDDVDDYQTLWVKLSKKFRSIKLQEKDSFITAFRDYITGEKTLNTLKQLIDKGTLTKIKEALRMNGKDKSSSQPTPTLGFDLQHGDKFYTDANVLLFLENIVPKNKLKVVKTEIDWIQKVHREGGYQKKSGDNVKLDDHSNQAVIKHFENNSKNKIDSTLLSKVVEKLKESYPN